MPLHRSQQEGGGRSEEAASSCRVCQRFQILNHSRTGLIPERILGRRKTPDARLLHRTEFETEASPSLMTRPPAKMGVTFSSMLTTCPADVSTRIGADFQKRYKISHTCLLCMHLCPQIMAYGGCVQRQLGSLEKGSCEKEFNALRACFTKAVRSSPPPCSCPSLNSSRVYYPSIVLLP